MEKLKNRHKRLLEMLCCFDKLCKEFEISYYLIGGSTLGAVRHHGFIPWDDDIDVAMYRADFERFEDEILKTKLDNIIYEPVEAHSFPEAPIGFLYDITDTKPTPQSPCIDVFPLDNVPNNRFLRKIQKTFAYLYHISVYRCPSKNRGSRNQFITTLFIKLTPKFMFNFYKRISKKIITAWKSNTKCVANIFGMKKYDNEIMPREFFGQAILYDFEGHKFPIPERFDDYLTKLFGDYKTLPPEEERFPHHIEKQEK